MFSEVQKRNLLAGSIIVVWFSFPGMLSFDIFAYITTAKILFFYKENPYIVLPMDFIGEQYLQFTRAINITSLYGPVWILLTGIPFILGIGIFPLILYSFKLLVLIFFLGVLWVMGKLTTRRSTVFLFALQPLVLIETLTSGHNDIAMMFFALVCFYFLKKKNIVLAILFILLSILTKYVTILLLPVVLIVIFRIIAKKTINWEKMYLICAAAMGIIFLFSFVREEIYPWYALWFLPFVYLTERKRYILSVTILSLGLMLRYTPYLYLNTYTDFSAVIKSALFGVFLVLSVIPLLIEVMSRIKGKQRVV
jgi:hypothetical protein